MPVDDDIELGLMDELKVRVVRDSGHWVYQAMNVGVQCASKTHVLFSNTGDELINHQSLQICLRDTYEKDETSYLFPVSVGWDEDLNSRQISLPGFLSAKRNSYVSHQ